MQKFRKKSDVIEAMQWDGENADAVVQWAQGDWKTSNNMQGGDGAIWLKQKVMPDNHDIAVWRLVIPTFGGEQDAAPGDWVVRGPTGVLSVISEAEFASKFELAA